MRTLFQRFTILFAGCLLGQSFKASAQSLISIGNTQVRVDTLITGLDVPWETTYQNGSLWVTERKGIVSRIDTATGIKKVILRLSGTVAQQAESGLLGLVLHPAFAQKPEVFLAYTYLNSGAMRERIVKYSYENDSLVNPVFLLNNLPGNSTHNGCRLLFLPDTTLLASTGDVQNLSLPQDTAELSGKVLRMKTNGTAPANNPFPGNLVYSYGHRNVQGMTTLPNGKVVLSEHGASTDDEVQLLMPGRNYGWPSVEGFCSTPTEINFCNANQVMEPLKAYTPTIAPSDMVFYQNPAFPEWHNTLLLTVLKNKQVRALRMNAGFESVTSDLAYLTNRYGRLRDIAIGANKEIYLATNGASWANTDPNTHSIIRLRPVPQTTSADPAMQPEIRLSIIPNPAGEQFAISLENEAMTGANAEIRDGLGRVVFKKTFEGNNMQVSSRELGASGWYVLHLTDASGRRQKIQKLLLK